jgi:predicted transcriptional regulator
MKPLLDQAIEHLEATKGRWPEVSKTTGVPYSTLAKVYQRVNRDPQISTVQRILDHRDTLLPVPAMHS